MYLRLLLLCSCPLSSLAQKEVLLADFEGKDYGGWKIEGEAFETKPAAGTLKGQQKVSGFKGKGLVNTFLAFDEPQGTLTSPKFKITHPYLTFLIGGGKHPGKTGMELLVDGKAVRTATGLDEEYLRWSSWSIKDLIGKEAQLRIFDYHSGGYGHINIDHISLSERPRGNEPTGRLSSYRNSPLYYRERYRPQYHFTPPLNWMNDPNGMVYYEGEWHLFYQHNPHGNSWGHMSWGHAVSKDLVHWEHLPIALQDSFGVMIFSGSAVVDWQNTSGFGKGKEPPLVAIYTGHGHGKQTQDLAYSNDRGRTWTKYRGNPVIDLNLKDFRDPKVIWHERSKQWIMAVVLPLEHKVRFYGSPNLKKWTQLSDFGKIGATGGIWECPDLFPLKVEGQTGKQKWVLLMNLNPGAPAGGSGCQYYVGDFDGTTFQLDASHPAKKADNKNAALWLDHGPDCYAAVTWSDVPESDGRRIAIGWMSNWQYATTLPTFPWRSAMTVPRTLSLHQTAEGLRLKQQPVAELQKLRTSSVTKHNLNVSKGNLPLDQFQISGECLELRLNFGPGPGVIECGLRVRKGHNEETIIGFNPESSELFIDRSRSGEIEFHPKFSGRHATKVPLKDNKLRLHIFIDDSSVEVFAQDGTHVLTDRIFPDPSSTGLELYSTGGDTEVSTLQAWALSSAWKR